jgi:ABC-type phosphate transport system auxiliary subunit
MSVIEVYAQRGVFGKTISECRSLAIDKIAALSKQKDAIRKQAGRKLLMINELRKQLSSETDSDCKMELLISIDEMNAEYMQMLDQSYALAYEAQDLQIFLYGEMSAEMQDNYYSDKK